MVRLLLFLIGLILYGSLYPWDFHFHRLDESPLVTLWMGWPARITRYVFRDLVINVLLYVPLGAVALVVLARRVGRMGGALGALALGVLLSLTVEVLQIFDRSRDASAFDVACNAAGTLLGIMLALAAAEPLRRLLARHRAQWRTNPAAVLLIALFVSAQLYPFFPRFSTHALAGKLHDLAALHFTWALLATATAAWLTIALAIEALTGARAAGRYYGLLLFVLPARLLLDTPAPSLGTMLGALLAWLLWKVLPARMPWRHAAAGVVALSAVAISQLAPYHFATRPAAFSWIPFAGTLNSEWGSAARILLGKALDYGALVWLLRAPLRGYAVSAAVAAIALAATEAAQVWLPGRTAEITDPLLAILMALVLAGVDRERS